MLTYQPKTNPPILPTFLHSRNTTRALEPINQTFVQPGDIKLKYNFYNLKVHEYNYPVVDEPGSLIGGRRDSTSSLKKRNALDAPPMKETTLIKTRLRCR